MRCMSIASGDGDSVRGPVVSTARASTDVWEGAALLIQKTLLVLLMVEIVFDPSTRLLSLHGFNLLLWGFGIVALIAAAATRFRRLRASYEALPLIAYVVTFALLIPIFAAAVYLLRTDTGAVVHNVFGRTYSEFAVLAMGVALGVGGLFFLRLTVWLITGLAGFMWLLYLLGFVIGTGPIGKVLRHHGLANYRPGHFGPLIPHLYYFTSPLLSLAGIYWLYRSFKQPTRWPLELLPLGLVITAMMMSGTRTNAILALCPLIALAWRRSKTLTIVGLGALAAGILIYVGVNGLHGLLGEDSARSDAARRSLFPAYAHGFADPLRLLFGDGLGSCVYSAERPDCWSVTEFTPLDAVRIFGLLGASLYAALLTVPLFRIKRTHPALWWAWLLYLISAITSASLFSPVGAVVVALVGLAAHEKAEPGLEAVETEWEAAR